jgi:bifunctional ADP-heptose synthase (sugar kinase/adenylyltransferase)
MILMLTENILEQILRGIPDLCVAVLGDLFLDRYLDIDSALTEPSVETGLDAYQVVRVRSSPGAAGTVINNLATLGVWGIPVIAVIGDDGEGFELRQALERMPSVAMQHVIACPERRTPTYTKPMLCKGGQLPRELNRLDIKNRRRLPLSVEEQVVRALDEVFPAVHALIVVDQVRDNDCGVVTRKVRKRLAELGAHCKTQVVLADSRARIGLFRNVALKPNEAECLSAVKGAVDAVPAARMLARRAGRTVFCTRGERGTLVAEPGNAEPTAVPGFAVAGPIDPVGAGDSTSAAIACALACEATPTQAAAFGNLVASITIQQLGTTGTASPVQVRRRWRQVQRRN